MLANNPLSMSKSAARVAAGKATTASLDPWRSDVREAIQELKANGYKGSLRLKKGSAVHKVVTEKRQARVLPGPVF